MEPVTKEVIFADGKRQAVIYIDFTNDPTLENMHKVYERCLPDALKKMEEKSKTAQPGNPSACKRDK